MEVQECRSDWVVTDEVSKQKQAHFYTQKYRSCETDGRSRLRVRHFEHVMKKDRYIVGWSTPIYNVDRSRRTRGVERTGCHVHGVLDHVNATEPDFSDKENSHLGYSIGELLHSA